MSFAMDDITPIYGVQGVQTHVRTQSSSKEEKIEDPSIEKPLNAEKIELSENFDKAANSLNEKLVKLQENENILEEASDALSSTKMSLNDIKASAQKLIDEELSKEERKNIEEEINKNLEKIQKISEETSFNDQKIFDGSKSEEGVKEVSLKTLGLPDEVSVDNEDQALKIMDQVEEASQEVQDRQMEITKNSKKIIESVSSHIELDSTPLEEVSIPENEEEAQAVKQEVQEEVFKSPAKNVKMQIKHFDKNMILAMLSLNNG